MKLNEGQSEYLAFPYWDHVGYVIDKTCYLLCPIAQEYMVAIRQQPGALKSTAWPMYISHDEAGGKCYVYPVPIQDFDLVAVEKSV